MKYMGSKSRIAKYIVPIIQKVIDDNNITNYYEPFCGGCNVIDKIKCKNKYASDKNEYLIELLNHVKNGGELFSSVDKELYNKARSIYNKHLQQNELTTYEIGNIGFLASYNGRFFDGGYAKSVYEKTKNGLRYRDYYQESKNNLYNQAKHLKDINFNCIDYRKINLDNLNNALIYCDPPYNTVKKYDNAKKFNYNEFWDIVRDWSGKFIVITSELQAPDDFITIWEKRVTRSLNTDNKSVATEKLFIHNSLLKLFN